MIVAAVAATLVISHRRRLIRVVAWAVNQAGETSSDLAWNASWGQAMQLHDGRTNLLRATVQPLSDRLQQLVLATIAIRASTRERRIATLFASLCDQL